MPLFLGGTDSDRHERELSEDVEPACEATADQEDQTKDRESGGEKEPTKGTEPSHTTVLLRYGGFTCHTGSRASSSCSGLSAGVKMAASVGGREQPQKQTAGA
ncbi:hypothetical protein COCON_G00101680 [Conger conger]|uniref:Uncharacterized protein n=1 Tax=Conger conger TaxID=82655 RepID=A0A9Q1DHV3_CONCO|nr:hypothetical protein COCON_G00101680 [Conger conger]